MSFICNIITYILELHEPLLNGHPSMVLGVLRSSLSCPTSDALVATSPLRRRIHH